MKAKIDFFPKPSGEPLVTCSNIDYSIKKSGYKLKIKINKGIPTPCFLGLLLNHNIMRTNIFNPFHLDLDLIYP